MFLFYEEVFWRGITMEKYQDYVIKDGEFIGKFEEMYQKFDDPWHQKDNLLTFYSRIVTPVTLMQYRLKNVIEMGCGLGAFTNYLKTMTHGCSIIGMDISETAIKKARTYYPEIKFYCGEILEFSKNPDEKIEAIIFSEIMWYILQDLDDIIENLTNKFKNKLIIVNQVFYKGEQRYGNDYFTSLEELVKYLPWKCLKKLSIDRIDDGFYESHSVYRIS